MLLCVKSAYDVARNRGRFKEKDINNHATIQRVSNKEYAIDMVYKLQFQTIKYYLYPILLLKIMKIEM